MLSDLLSHEYMFLFTVVALVTYYAIIDNGLISAVLVMIG